MSAENEADRVIHYVRKITLWALTAQFALAAWVLVILGAPMNAPAGLGLVAAVFASLLIAEAEDGFNRRFWSSIPPLRDYEFGSGLENTRAE